MAMLNCRYYRGASLIAAIALGLALLTGPEMVGAHSIPTYVAENPEEMAMIRPARAEAERQMGRPLLLKTTSLRYRDGWAFLYSNLIDTKGDPLDLAGTPLEKAAQEGMASRVFCALLKFDAGTWKVVASCLGVTDVAWKGWDKKYHAPPEIFELQNAD